MSSANSFAWHHTSGVRLKREKKSRHLHQIEQCLQNSWLSRDIIRGAHSDGHPKINHTVAAVRQRYWIPKLRAQILRIVRKCNPCQKFNNLSFKYPNKRAFRKRRVQRFRPFAHVGLDYSGSSCMAHPEENEGKCYGCINTCTVTKLIHLDVVAKLSTTSFLRILRRFFSRREIPISATSDNAPTFALWDNILRDFTVAVQAIWK